LKNLKIETLQITIALEPMAWKRVRAGRGVFFKDRASRAYANMLGYEFAKAKMAAAWNPAKAAWLECIFYRSTYRRIDNDNLIKIVQDAGNKILWLDDAQLVHTAQDKKYDKANPRTEITVRYGQPWGAKS